MMTAEDVDAAFSGVIGQEYQMLKLICPFAAEMSRMVGAEVAHYCRNRPDTQSVVELGGGTGITTLAILSGADNLRVLSIDSEPVMQNQAKQALQAWENGGRLAFFADDALSALGRFEDASVDIVASAYTLHNFEANYRKRVIAESFRVLKSGGRFVNGDRYALDDVDQHTRNTQQEVKGYFRVLSEIDRLDLLEQWIVHLFSDESESRIMRESISLQQLGEAGFQQIELKFRQDSNALVTALKH
ncbi:MAG: methyltransferase domain-containing protein [Methylomonas sp.]|nr:methyltransferase domain-containing protein [Methylomonas sp.]